MGDGIARYLPYETHDIITKNSRFGVCTEEFAIPHPPSVKRHTLHVHAPDSLCCAISGNKDVSTYLHTYVFGANVAHVRFGPHALVSDQLTGTRRRHPTALSLSLSLETAHPPARPLRAPYPTERLEMRPCPTANLCSQNLQYCHKYYACNRRTPTPRGRRCSSTSCSWTRPSRPR